MTVPLGTVIFVLDMKRADNKPSSVVGNHLSEEYVTIPFKPPFKALSDEQPIAFVGVASDRVYRSRMLPYNPVSSYLAFPPLPEKTGGISLLHSP